MYIEQAFKYAHQGWRYLVGLLIAFFASQLGSIPLVLVVTMKILADGGDLSELEDESKIMTVLDPNLTLFLVLLSFAVGMVALYLVVRYMHRQPFLTLTTSRSRVDWSRVFFGFGLIALTTVVLTLVDYYGNPDDYLLQFDLVPFLILALIAIVLIPVQTSFEEYLFRGYLMQGLGVLSRNRWLPLLLTSFVFGGLHILNPEVDKLGYVIMFYYVGTGLFLGIITLMDEGMELALGFHAGNNLVAALLVTADWTVFQTNSILKDVSDPSAGFDVLAPVFVVYPLFLFIMARKYGWNNWNVKLLGPVVPPATDNEN
jgi:membrane protease YdiL (CAAX protease family)